jgi:barstar (barnase inhibitor)
MACRVAPRVIGQEPLATHAALPKSRLPTSAARGCLVPSGLRILSLQEQTLGLLTQRCRSLHIRSHRTGSGDISLQHQGSDRPAAFFDAIRHTLPLDPPLVGSRSWDALSDSLWSGLHEVSDNSIAIFWTGSSDFKDATSSDYSIALEILKDITGSLTDQSITNGRPKQVSVYIS